MCPSGTVGQRGAHGDSGTMRNHLKCVVVCSLWFLAVGVHAAERQTLRGHVPATAARLEPVGRLAVTKRLELAIGLPLRNREGLTNLLRQLYDPASGGFRHYLTPEQFTEAFGPTEPEYQTVIAFAKANGLAVTGTHANRMLVDVAGAVADVERAFHVKLRVYPHPQDARTFFAPEAEPSVDKGLRVLHISGLDNYTLPHPRVRHRPTWPASRGHPARRLRAGRFRRLFRQRLPECIRAGPLAHRHRADSRSVRDGRLLCGGHRRL